MESYPSPTIPRPHRQSYTQRRGHGPLAKPLTFEIVAQQLAHVLTRFRDCGYFQQAFGYDCVDDDEAYGALGPPSLST
jgi:hypothetical protein